MIVFKRSENKTKTIGKRKKKTIIFQKNENINIPIFKRWQQGKEPMIQVSNKTKFSHICCHAFQDYIKSVKTENKEHMILHLFYCEIGTLLKF